jgi:hypothetical protein
MIFCFLTGQIFTGLVSWVGFKLDHKAGFGPKGDSLRRKRILTHLADGECRRPLRSEDVQANGAVRVDVWMINASSERILSDGKKNPEQLQYQYLADGECRRPLRSEDVQANGAVRVDVRMINASSERILSDGKERIPSN